VLLEGKYLSEVLLEGKYLPEVLLEGKYYCNRSISVTELLM
jgi:hypothetical protein